MNKREVGKGTVLGALAGDAAGATLEFMGKKPHRDEVIHALKMVGGGCWRTAPGQVTDDGEMMLCLMQALAEADTFSIARVAGKYLQWHLSLPFDAGLTTSTGLAGGIGRPEDEIHEGMWQAAALANGGSKANGSLMRIAPLGVWGSRLSEEALVEAACMDSRLTHNNPVCQHASAVYCLAIRHLMRNPGDSAGAFTTAQEWAFRLGDSEVQDWLALAAEDVDVGYWPKSGFVKYAFIHAFRHLKKRSSYPDAIFETLLGGGDTDTNACIVGGLTGALHGEEGIPAHMKQAVLECDTVRGIPRPEFLQIRVQLPLLWDKLIECDKG